MPDSYPSRRPIDPDFREPDGEPPLPPQLTNIPWVDIHNHAHTLSWNNREQFALSGCHTMVMMAAGYYWLPYKPAESDDVRYLWDDALNRLDQIRRSHGFDAKLAVGIHTGTRVENWEKLVEVMPEYCELDEVAAVGEIGITASQHVESWGLDEQKLVVGRQLELARKHELPAVLHTPSDPDSVDLPYRDRGTMPGYELDTDLQQPPVIDGEDVKREAVEIDIELKDDAGLSDEQLILSHANRDVAPFVIETTDCYLSFTTSYPWLHDVTPRDVAAVISEYGPEQILLETDSAGVLRNDIFSLKRFIFELYRLGIEPDDIRTVVFENPMEILGQSA